MYGGRKISTVIQCFVNAILVVEIEKVVVNET